MTAFIYVISIILVLSIIARIIGLSTGLIPQRTPRDVGWDLVGDIALLVWAIVLLTQSV
jgi:hypothetical protein